jgi:hypothetical protein
MVAWNIIHFPFPSILHYMVFLLTAPTFIMVRVSFEELINNPCDGISKYRQPSFATVLQRGLLYTYITTYFS